MPFQRQKKNGKYLLLFNDKNTIIGLIPFVIQKNVFYSLPFTTHCEPLIPEGVTIDHLTKEIKKIIPDINGFRFRFREDKILHHHNFESNYLNHLIFLSDNIEEVSKSLGRRTIRRFIKKSYQSGFKLRMGTNNKDLEIFYELECRLRKSIGLPPAPLEFFLSLWDNLYHRNLLLLPIVEKNNKPIAGFLILRFKDTICFEFTAIDKKYINWYPNHYLHWEVIKLAHSEFNTRIIDLGRTDKNQSGLVFFKENWNAKATNIIEYCYPRKKKFKEGIHYRIFKFLNKHLPLDVLKLEGRLLFSKFD